MNELEKFYAERDSLNEEAVRLTQKREELDKRLKQFLTEKLEAKGIIEDAFAEFNGKKFCFSHLKVEGTMVTVFKKNKPKLKRYCFFDVFFHKSLNEFINEVKVVDGEK